MSDNIPALSGSMVLALYKSRGGFVRDQSSAVELAKIHIRNLYGQQQLDDHQGFYASPSDTAWIVRAINRTNNLEAIIVIAKADAQVLHLNVPMLFSDAIEGRY